MRLRLFHSYGVIWAGGRENRGTLSPETLFLSVPSAPVLHKGPGTSGWETVVLGGQLVSTSSFWGHRSW